MKVRILNRLLKWIILVTLTFSMSCATVFVGQIEKVDLESAPLGAEVYIDGNYKGKNPLEIKLEKNQSYHLEFKLPNEETKVYTLNRKIGSGWLILDIVTGFVPVIVDAVTGSWYSFDTDNLYINWNEDQEVTNWKFEVAEVIGEVSSTRYQYDSSLWSVYKDRKKTDISPREWTMHLTEQDFNNFKSSQKSLNDWLFYKIEQELEESE